MDRAWAIGRCYETAARAVVPWFASADYEVVASIDAVPVLVHGWPTTTGDDAGRVFGHAWVEVGPLVWDPTTGDLVPRALYYRVGRINPKLCRRYSAKEAAQEINQEKTWGPWGAIPLVRGEVPAFAVP